MPVRREREGGAGRPPGAQRADLARLPAPGRPRPAVRLPGARPVRAVGRAALQPGQAAARPVREGDRRARRVGPGPVLLPLRRPGLVRRHRLLALRDEVRGDQPLLRLVRRPAPARALQRVGDLRGARQGHDGAAPGHPGRGARHLRGPGAPEDDPALQADGRDGRRADAGAPVRQRLDAGRQGPVQLLGLQHHRLLRPAQRLRELRHARRAGAGVQDDGAHAAPGRHRGHPRRRLQPHRRGQPPGPDAVVPRRGQPRPTTASSTATRATTTTPPAPATASTSATTSRCG